MHNFTDIVAICELIEAIESTGWYILEVVSNIVKKYSY